MNCRVTVFLGLSVHTRGVIAMVIRKRAILLSAEVGLFFLRTACWDTMSQILEHSITFPR